MRLTTLGISSLNDNIYREIAAGLHESTSLQLFLMGNIFMFCFVCGTLFGTWKMRKVLLKEEGTEKKKENGPKKILPFFVRSRYFPIFISIYFALLVVVFSFDIFRTIYVNNAITYYDQVISIILPNLSDVEYKTYNSQFAQIRTGEDYKNLIISLEVIAKEKGYLLPNRPTLL